MLKSRLARRLVPAAALALIGVVGLGEITVATAAPMHLAGRASTKIYTVQYGDSLKRIGKVTNTALKDLLALNKLRLSSVVWPGMRLRLPSTSVVPTLYVTGEESVEQIGVRARRIGADSESLLLADENDLATLLGHIEEHDPVLVVVDSVQTIASSDIDGRAGGMTQVVEITSVLSRVAKSRRMPMLLVGQSTKDSSIAGPRAMEHLVDTVLTFEGDRHTSLRLLRAVKNRYGPADEIVCFEQADDGLREVVDASDLWREHRERPVPGTCVTVTMEGRRPMLAEVQSLVTEATNPNPRRGVSGLPADPLDRPATPSGVALRRILHLAPDLAAAAATREAHHPPFASR